MKLLPAAALLAIVLPASGLKASHPFLCTDSYANTVSVVSAEGKVVWQHACQHPQDCWLMPNGDYLFCHATGALEMTPYSKVVWEYKSGPNTEVHACQPLPDGSVMLVENGPCRIIEVNRQGSIVKEIKLTPPPASISLHNQFRGTRKTLDGHYFVSRKGEHKVEELDADGRTIRFIPIDGDVHEFLPLPNGHFLVACGEGRKVQELDSSLKVVWEISGDELPGNPLRLMTGFQRLPNGNTVCCNYLGHGHVGTQPVFFEITPDKKVVWQFRDDLHFKVVNQIQVLDVPGDATKGEILR
jgi:hypothetical protein